MSNIHARLWFNFEPPCTLCSMVICDGLTPNCLTFTHVASSSHTHTHLLAGVAPVYLADDCRQLSDIGCRPLRFGSSDIRMLSVPATHNRFGDRSFTAAVPRLWNELPADLRWPNLAFPVLKQKLKTYLFGLACS